MAIVVTLGAASQTAFTNFAASQTFTNMNGGVQFPANTTIIILAAYQGGSIPSPAATIGGTTLKQGVIANHSSGSLGCITIFYLDTSITVTDTLVLSGTGSIQYTGAYAYYMTGNASGGPVSTNTNIALPASPTQATITIASGDVTFCGAVALAVATYTPAWTNCQNSTSDSVSSITSHIQINANRSSTTGSPTTIGVNGGTFATLLALADWQVSASAATETMMPMISM